ncbi:hypothetical protein CHS0354_013726 [Potamilus streckersoni]|uniref:Uncharacterized protein n=1 Tax=Potamilus streckersoni TaxID=2493646 RepID=A0AAE0SBP8_9BIVA|nr:hypothetical protein CHS0354_013726 [Potamilus streckersoni]
MVALSQTKEIGGKIRAFSPTEIQMMEQGRILLAHRAPGNLVIDLTSFSEAERFRPGEILQYLVSRGKTLVSLLQEVSEPREEKAEEIGEINTSASSSQGTSIKISSMGKDKWEEARQASSSKRKSQMESKENSEINSKNMKRKPN